MSDLTQYLLAQAARRPLATARFAAGEAWRRSRRRWSNGIERSLPAFSTDSRAEHFAPFLPAGLISADYGRLFPERREQIQANANSICRHEFEIFGRQFAAGPAINWHRDYEAGHDWPCAPPGELRILNAPSGADVKRPWELARFHHGLTLGQAFFLTQDETYAREFAAQVLNWAQANPYPRGIHWAMPMEAGIRAVNLCTTGAFFVNAGALTRDFWQQFLALLFLHGRFLNLHREWNPVARGNHHLGCLLGLLCAGVLFRAESEARAWLRDAQAALRTEMDSQVGADGVAHEGASNYHAFVTEMMTAAAVVATRASSGDARQPVSAATIEHAWGAAFRARLETLFDFPSALLEARRTPPILGDSDDGRLLPFCNGSDAGVLSREFTAEASSPAASKSEISNLKSSFPARGPFSKPGTTAVQHVLATGRALFAGPQWPAPHPSCEQAWWMLGATEPPLPRSASRERPPVNSFPGAGFYFFDSQRIRGSIRCGPLGVNGWANHAHCDQLNVEFCLDGEPVVVDPGTYLYSGDAQARNLFRGSRSHNAPVVDAAEQNRFWPGLLFRIMDDTRSVTLTWKESSDAVRFAGIHRGYERRPQRIVVQRELKLDRATHSLLIVDSLTGAGAASVEWFWQFAPAIAPQQAMPRSPPVCPVDASLPLAAAWIAGPVEVQMWLSNSASEVRSEALDGWVAPRYGHRTRAKQLRVSCRTQFPLQAVFLFTPRNSRGAEKS